MESLKMSQCAEVTHVNVNKNKNDDDYKIVIVFTI